MQIVIGNVLSADEVALVREALAHATFEDGRETAGFAARLVKNNRQAANDRKIETVRKLVEERILGNDVFALAVRPKALTSVMFSRYESGMHYGSHVDDALMQGMRTDVSFTLFLSEPDSYDGGELVIESASGEDAVKLAGRQPRRLSVDRAASRRAGDARRRGSPRSAGRAASCATRRSARCCSISTPRGGRCLRARARARSTTWCRSRWRICCGCGWRIETRHLI